MCSKWVGARCWCAGLLLASVVSGRASLLHVSVVSVRREEEEEEEEEEEGEEEFFNRAESRYSVSVLCRLPAALIYHGS